MTVQEFFNIDKDLQTVQDISDVNIIILIYLFIKHVLVWRYNKFGDKLRDIENRKLCDHIKRETFNSTDMHFALVQIHKYK
jgi:hypothetical protein